MSSRRVLCLLILLGVFMAVGLEAQEPVREGIANWPAPPLWSWSGAQAAQTAAGPGETSEGRAGQPAAYAESLAAVPTPPLPLIGINACRIADTRVGSGFTGQYGPPALSGGGPRNFTLTGQCGIAGTAQAVSLNITAVNTLGPGFILIFPQGGAQPLVSTLNYVGGQTVANAAVVPLGTGGGVTVIAGVSGTDLIIDTNGYYAPQTLVSTLNTLSGDLTLAAGTNVTITPSGQTLTIASTGGLPVGAVNQTLRHSGSAWAANSALTSDGTNVALTGALALPGSVRVTAGADRFLHNFGTSNTFLGAGAGNLTMTGNFNTGIGVNALSSNTTGFLNMASGNEALASNTTGFRNTASGYQALVFNTTGAANTASGLQALARNTTGNGNTASGYQALAFNTTGDVNTASGNSALFSNTTGFSNTASGNSALFRNTTGNGNTASGQAALFNNTTGDANTASGDSALRSNTTGSGNIAIGVNAGFGLTTGSNNIDIGNQGFAGEANTIRIGDAQTATFIAGINGTSIGVGAAVGINASGQLGTTFTPSSRRFKENIREIAQESEALMKLRPVAFRYRPEIDPTGLPQYGLIAEEVAEVYPDLVVSDRDGKPETVRYHLVNALLLNEVQKQRRAIESQRETIEEQRGQIATLRKEKDEQLMALEARLAELEASARETHISSRQ